MRTLSCYGRAGGGAMAFEIAELSVSGQECRPLCPETIFPGLALAGLKSREGSPGLRALSPERRGTSLFLLGGPSGTRLGPLKGGKILPHLRLSSGKVLKDGRASKVKGGRALRYGRPS